MIGTRFARLVVAESTDTPRTWLCHCDCGGITLARSDHLKAGVKQSCGCLRAEKTAARNLDRRKHGMRGSPEYSSWQAMRTRCLNPKADQYARYGGAGITVSARWHDFAAFLEDMGPRPEGTTLDRIDPKGNYEPGNCRWATMPEQENNKTNNRRITYKGETKTVAEWAAATGLAYHTIRMRILHGWSAEEALTMPATSRRPRWTRATTATTTR